MKMIEQMSSAVREEIVRQYRDDRGKCPGGAHFYEEHIAPNLVARAVLKAMNEPTHEMMTAAFNDYMGYEREGPQKPPWNGRTMWGAMLRACA